jgi:hypothetical protein
MYREMIDKDMPKNITKFSKDEEFSLQIEIEERYVLMMQFEKYKDLISPFSEQNKIITRELFCRFLEELELEIGKSQLEIIRELDYILRLYEINPKGTLNEMIHAYRDNDWLNWEFDERAMA